MKKCLWLICICFLLFACQSKTVEVLNIQGIQEIDYEKLTQNLKSNVKFILYIGRPDCGDCQQFYPYLEKYIETHAQTGIYYLNVKSLRDRANADDASKEEKEFYENLQKNLDFDWTPTIEIIENGKIIKSYQYLDENYFKIQDREKQIQKREEYIKEFQSFMDNYYKENKNEEVPEM